MQTLYLIVITAIGGLLTLFASAGWTSYNEKKLPDMPVLFRWFVTGVLGFGLAAYAWIFGAGGDPSTVLEKIGDSLEVQELVKGLTSAVGHTEGAILPAATTALSGIAELTVGMPKF